MIGFVRLSLGVSACSQCLHIHASYSIPILSPFPSLYALLFVIHRIFYLLVVQRCDIVATVHFLSPSPFFLLAGVAMIVTVPRSTPIVTPNLHRHDDATPSRAPDPVIAMATAVGALSVAVETRVTFQTMERSVPIATRGQVVIQMSTATFPVQIFQKKIVILGNVTTTTNQTIIERGLASVALGGRETKTKSRCRGDTNIVRRVPDRAQRNPVTLGSIAVAKTSPVVGRKRRKTRRRRSTRRKIRRTKTRHQNLQRKLPSVVWEELVHCVR